MPNLPVEFTFHPCPIIFSKVSLSLLCIASMIGYSSLLKYPAYGTLLLNILQEFNVINNIAKNFFIYCDILQVVSDYWRTLFRLLCLNGFE